MRVKITGESLPARDLRDMVRNDSDLTLVNIWTKIEIDLTEDDVEYVTIDGVDSPIERHLLRALSQLVPAVLIRFGSGSERRFKVVIPKGDGDLAYRAARGLYRGMLYVAGK